jgi:arylsulfatase A-like enzyme
LAVSTLDSLFRELMSIVEQTTAPQNAMWIVTSDHGEGLENHGDRLHGHEVFDETAHVPLAIHHPSLDARTQEGLVPLDCIAATILRSASVQPAEWMNDAVLHPTEWSPVSSLISETFSERDATTVEPMPEDQAIRTDAWSLIVENHQERIHLYDRANDRSEMNDVFKLHRTISDSLLALLSCAAGGQEQVFSPGSITQDRELTNALRALGYVE